MYTPAAHPDFGSMRGARTDPCSSLASLRIGQGAPPMNWGWVWGVLGAVHVMDQGCASEPTWEFGHGPLAVACPAEPSIVRVRATGPFYRVAQRRQSCRARFWNFPHRSSSGPPAHAQSQLGSSQRCRRRMWLLVARRRADRCRLDLLQLSERLRRLRAPHFDLGQWI